MEPTSILCASCGGPLPASAADSVVTCPFCGVSAKPAPKIVTVERVVAVHGDASSGPLCPRCASAIRESAVGDHRIVGCSSCGGLWLDHRAVEYLANHNDVDFANAVQRRIGVVMRQLDCSALLTCPTCAAAMDRREIVGEGYSVTVDVCKLHGTWFDAGELRQFTTIFANRRASTPDDDLPRVPSSEGGFFSDLLESIRAMF